MTDDTYRLTRLSFSSVVAGEDDDLTIQPKITGTMNGRTFEVLVPPLRRDKLRQLRNLLNIMLGLDDVAIELSEAEEIDVTLDDVIEL